MNVGDAPANPSAPDPLRRKLLLAIAAVALLAVALAARLVLERGATIQSEPPGASIFLNGQLVGKTPLTLHNLDRGAYSVRLEKEDCAVVSAHLIVGWTSTALALKLPARGTGSLKVDVAPAGADVLLDGELIGYTPFESAAIEAGAHELTIRKTNFKPYLQRIDIQSGQQLEYRDFALEDLVFTMLQNAIDREPQRVAHYNDMGRYLFSNNRIKESADYFVRGLKASAESLKFDKGTTAEERELVQRERNDDMQRINDDIRKLQQGHGRGTATRDLDEWVRLITQQQNDNATANPEDWNLVQKQAENFANDNKFEQAEKVLVGHIKVAGQQQTAAQAYIYLITVRLRMQHGQDALQAGNAFAATHFPTSPPLARQCANAIYGNVAHLPAADRTALLALAEQLLRRALAGSPKRSEMGALCKFELGNVLVLEERPADAIPLYRDSVAETAEPTNKALRSEREVEALVVLKRIPEAREILNLLAANTHSDIADWARSKLKEITNYELRITN